MCASLCSCSTGISNPNPNSTWEVVVKPTGCLCYVSMLQWKSSVLLPEHLGYERACWEWHRMRDGKEGDILVWFILSSPVAYSVSLPAHLLWPLGILAAAQLSWCSHGLIHCSCRHVLEAAFVQNALSRVLANFAVCKIFTSRPAMQSFKLKKAQRSSSQRLPIPTLVLPFSPTAYWVMARKY